MTQIRIDWEELSDAFEDGSMDHRYYLDRETGVVHFFSSYLDNEEEKKTEAQIRSEGRYVSIPISRRVLPPGDLNEFINGLEQARDRRLLSVTLHGSDTYRRFSEALDTLPKIQEKWSHFQKTVQHQRAKEWLAEVGVEPLDE
jgi:hypothetical protein